MTTNLPDGFQMRPVTIDDATGCLSLFNAISQAGFRTDDWTLDDIRASLQSLTLPDGGQVIHSTDAEIVAYGDIRFGEAPPIFPQIRVMIHPQYSTNYDIGLHMLTWCEERAKSALEKCPSDVRVAYRIFIDDKHPPSVALVEKFGMQPFRRNYLMQIDKLDTLSTSVTLDDFTIRPMRYPEELAAVVKVTMETLYDMWAMLEEPFEAVFERYQEHTAEEDFDPTIWFVVEDNATGELAGMCLCETGFLNDPDAGYIYQLGVRKSYRRRGIGNAMLQYVFNQFWQRGYARVTLGVDAESTTGAVQLYQQAGMFVARSGKFYEKELRAGRKVNWARL